MDLLKPWIEYIRKNELLQPGQTAIVAVSGGIDSMVLAFLCRQAGLPMIIAHCNFGLRGEASEADELFVKNYALNQGIPFERVRFDTREYAEEFKLSIQVAARQLRYNWFEQLLAHNGGKSQARVFTGHHADDNIETMLMNFFKGTGIAGLRGIRPLNGWLGRPLLFASREQILEYAQANGIEWRNDQSNEENKYTRNYFRNQIIPLVRSVIPEAMQNMMDNQQRFADVEVLYQEAVGNRLKKLLVHQGEEIHIPVHKLLLSPAPATLVFELSRPYGFTAAQTAGIMELCHSETGRYIDAPAYRVLRNRAWLVLLPRSGSPVSLNIIEGPGTITLPSGVLDIRSAERNADLITGPNEILVDSARLEYPLIIRPWKTGDYFYPLGMRRKKKIARFLIDQKLALHQKERVLVLESAKRVVWVVGRRMDDRFLVNESTRDITALSWSPGAGQ